MDTDSGVSDYRHGIYRWRTVKDCYCPAHVSDTEFAGVFRSVGERAERRAGAAAGGGVATYRAGAAQQEQHPPHRQDRRNKRGGTA